MIIEHSGINIGQHPAVQIEAGDTDHLEEV